MCTPECCAKKRRVVKEIVEEVPKVVLPTPESILYTYEVIKRMADFIIKRTEVRPKYGIICGSGLSHLAELIENPIIIKYQDIPNFPVSIDIELSYWYIGTINGGTVMALQQRFHSYDGCTQAACCLPVRVMKLCGVQYLYVTNAAGAVNVKYGIGDIMLLHDHINFPSLMGVSPLQGPNDPRFGKRLISLENTYDKDLLKKAVNIGQTLGIEKFLHVGVYACLGGPAVETDAEQKFLRHIGVDAVGMSTVHEVITARHCNMHVLAFSLITTPDVQRLLASNKPFSYDEPVQIPKHRLRACSELVKRLIYQIEYEPE